MAKVVPGLSEDQSLSYQYNANDYQIFGSFSVIIWDIGQENILADHRCDSQHPANDLLLCNKQMSGRQDSAHFYPTP